MIKQTFNTPAGEITWITMKNSTGATVTLSSLGAGIISVIVPDRQGNMVDVALGYKSPEDYIQDGPNCGKTAGRFANRIANGQFTLNGQTYHLPVNLPPNHLHGGHRGFANKLWTVDSATDAQVVFSLISPDGDMGYPGTLHLTATYRWTDDNLLEIVYNAVTDKPTVVNLTNHAYWNLNGSGSILGHILQMNASRYLVTDKYLTPTGEIANVQGTPLDFITPKPLGQDIKQPFRPLIDANGYDQCLIFDFASPRRIQPQASLTSDLTGITMQVATDSPAAMLYTGNWLEGAPDSRSGHPFHAYDGVAVECQGYPDAPNHPHFPSTTLNPGETYSNTIIYSFSTL
ncbi:MAG: galactose mutarotase [Muribaculaceae bacterium]|nr:galactose mutarotase [Muribaculaceae bacterium]